MPKSKIEELSSSKVDHLISQLIPILTDANEKQNFSSNTNVVFEGVTDVIRQLINKGATYKQIANLMSQAKILKKENIQVTARQVGEFCKNNKIEKPKKSSNSELKNQKKMIKTENALNENQNTDAFANRERNSVAIEPETI